MTEKNPAASSMNLPPTPKQIRAITKLATALGISDPIENDPRNRREARNLIYHMRLQLREKNGQTDIT